MYYEVHGSGWPLVLLHGGMSTIDLAFVVVVRALSQGRQVIASPSSTTRFRARPRHQ
jgi:hypothetical protein